jgi:uncharacterized delta-60 repeat protein
MGAVRAGVAVTAIAALLAVAAPGAVAADGDLDPSFGQGGSATYDLGGSPAESSMAQAAAVQADGRIVLAGSTHGQGGASDLLLTRVLPDGQLDTGFGSGGSTWFNPRAPQAGSSYLQRVAIGPG